MTSKAEAENEPESNDKTVPLAPFNEAEPFELAALAVLLSKGEEPRKSLPAAASLWAQAYQYREQLRHLFWGEKYEKTAGFTPPVWSVGTDEEFITVEDACTKYDWSVRHLRGLLKAILPPHILEYYWKAPPGLKVGSIPLPRTLLDRLASQQAEKRSARSRKAVKSQ